MHHRPAAPPPIARLTGAFTRWGLLLRGYLRVRAARLALAGAVTTAVTVLLLALPVVSGLGPGTRSMVLDSSSSTTPPPAAEGESPVIMGVDGGPIASSSFAGAAPSATAGGTTAAAGPGATGAAPGGSDSAPEPTATPDAPETAAAPATTDPAASPAGGSPADVGPSTRSSSGSPSRAPSAGPSSSRPSSEPSAPVREKPDAAVPPAAAPAEEPTEDAAEEPAEVDTEAELLALLDGARTGCAPLDADRALTAAARAHSKEMRETGRLAPVEEGPAGSIAQGGSQAEDVLAGWLTDPTGRATILDCDRGSVGIGLVEGRDGPWWTLLLA